MIASFLLVALCASIAFVVLGLGVFFALLKLGVIVRESQRPVHQDFGTYTLSQGREVRPEEEQPTARERVQ